MTQLAWSPDSRIVATVGVNNEPIELRDREGKNPQWLLFPVSTITLWDARTGELKQSLGAERKTAIHGIAFSPDQKTAAAVVLKHPEKMYSMWTQKAPGDLPPRDKLEVRIVDAETWALKRTVQVEGGSMQSIAFSPDGQTLAIGGEQLFGS